MSLLQAFQYRILPYKRDAELASDVANQLQEMNVVLSHVNVNRMEALAKR